MSNGNPNPPSRDGNAVARADTPQIEVLFAGDLAADDHLWVVRCSVEELHQMFVNPVAWVANLVNLPDWVILGSLKQAPAAVLTNDFAMVAERTDRVDPDGWVIVQGIGGTNAITLVAAKDVAIHSAQIETGSDDNSFTTFWQRVAADPDNQPSGRKSYPIVVLEDQSRWYGHFEIRDAVMSSDAIARRTATFLLATLYDPAGYAEMLNVLDQKTQHVKGKTEGGTDPIKIAPAATPPTSTFYANATIPVGSAVALGDDPPPPDPFICTITDGTYSGGTGTNDGGTIKRYGIEDPPPPPPQP